MNEGLQPTVTDYDMSSQDRIQINPAQVQALIESQFPQWSDQGVRAVGTSGWDNHSFRLGDGMLVRLPSAACYAAQVKKEHRWLPYLGGLLPFSIPVPLALGQPSSTYRWPWSVYGWIEGQTAQVGSIGDPVEFAASLAAFVKSLQGVPTQGGPSAGQHNFFRGGDLAFYDAETCQCLDDLKTEIDIVAATAVWKQALDAPWHGTDVWLHGDLSAANLLVRDAELCAVIDFGLCAVGDPACDLVISWTFLTGDGRRAFQRAIGADSAMWARTKGWALWKALLDLRNGLNDGSDTTRSHRIISDVIRDDIA